ncbi:MAG: serine/threonine protein kinase, partial [Pseudomonadota bacterium]
MTDQHPFSALGPDQVLTAIESTGLICDGRMLALNSYENRVYQVGIEAGEPIVAKFYRPARWSREQIEEEHQFIRELEAAELPVVAPLLNAEGSSLYDYPPFKFAIFPRRGGRLPELDFDTLNSVGQTLGKLHSIGRLRPFRFRQELTVAGHGETSCHFLLENDFIPSELLPAYESLTNDLLDRIDDVFHDCEQVSHLRLHGDCHP